MRVLARMHSSSLRFELVRPWAFVTVCALLGYGCAAGRRAAAIPSAEQERCSAIADSLSKYISEDALPFAQVAGNARTLPAPSGMRPGDSVAVEFVVFPNGTADTSSVQIMGPSGPDFLRRTVEFATRTRFTPAQVSGCNVMSRYNLVVKSRG